ncbi:hypothetical protein ACVGOW_03685 [Pseudonocardia saturnea]
MSRPHLPLLSAAAVVLVTVGALLLTGGGSVPPSGGEPTLGPVLDHEDRAALDAAPVLRGADPPAPDPGITLTDPEATVRAYLQAAHAVAGGDGGRTHLRAAPYAVPGTAAATVGVLVLDPPPPGGERTASVRSVELVAADHADRRRGYLAAVETRTVPGGDRTVFTSSVVVVRQPDGRWLVAAETPENPDLPAGED